MLQNIFNESQEAQPKSGLVSRFGVVKGGLLQITYSFPNRLNPIRFNHASCGRSCPAYLSEKVLAIDVTYHQTVYSSTTASALSQSSNTQPIVINHPGHHHRFWKAPVGSVYCSQHHRLSSLEYTSRPS